MSYSRTEIIGYEPEVKDAELGTDVWPVAMVPVLNEGLRAATIRSGAALYIATPDGRSYRPP